MIDLLKEIDLEYTVKEIGLLDEEISFLNKNYILYRSYPIGFIDRGIPNVLIETGIKTKFEIYVFNNTEYNPIERQKLALETTKLVIRTLIENGFTELDSLEPYWHSDSNSMISGFCLTGTFEDSL